MESNCTLRFGFLKRIVFVFSWDQCKSHEKQETMLMQNLERKRKSIMVFSEVAYYLVEQGKKITFVWGDSKNYFDAGEQQKINVWRRESFT